MRRDVCANHNLCAEASAQTTACAKEGELPGVREVERSETKRHPGMVALATTSITRDANKINFVIPAKG